MYSAVGAWSPRHTTKRAHVRPSFVRRRVRVPGARSRRLLLLDGRRERRPGSGEKKKGRKARREEQGGGTGIKASVDDHDGCVGKEDSGGGSDAQRWRRRSGRERGEKRGAGGEGKKKTRSTRALLLALRRSFRARDARTRTQNVKECACEIEERRERGTRGKNEKGKKAISTGATARRRRRGGCSWRRRWALCFFLLVSFLFCTCVLEDWGWGTSRKSPAQSGFGALPLYLSFFVTFFRFGYRWSSPAGFDCPPTRRPWRCRRASVFFCKRKRGKKSSL